MIVTQAAVEVGIAAQLHQKELILDVQWHSPREDAKIIPTRDD
jgi:hypothetical protein